MNTFKDAYAPVALTKGRVEATLAGGVIADRYDVLELLGMGGMGAVYRVHDRELDEVVALKVILRELAALPAMVERFRHEVKLARRVTHVNVARTFELGTTDGMMFCTMELIQGESLAKRLLRGPLAIEEATAIACAVCDGLAAAHAAGVIHRDIKPDNVLIAHDGRVVIADFGVAAAGAGAAGELTGTPAYMSPEQARGEPANAAADVYALGVMLAEMVTGTCPFSGTLYEMVAAKQDTDRVVVGGSVPAALATVIGQATARSQTERVTTASALRRALEGFAGAPRDVTMPLLPRAAPVASELRTVVVLAPRASERYAEARYLAEAVYEQLLALLNKKPRLRVLPRTIPDAGPQTLGVCFDVTEQLEVTITLESGSPIALRFPLGIAHVGSSAVTIAAALDGAIARSLDSDARRDEAYDLMLRARHIANRDYSRMPEARDLLRRALELCPQDPLISATLAIVYIRGAFFLPKGLPDATHDARELATYAITTAPELAEAHLAMGHLELQAGNPVTAASHFRRAIACAPHLAEAHEQLGRMLLEAGYIMPAIARLTDAIAMAPELRSAQWEIARAYALEGRWDENRAILEGLTTGMDRPLSRARYAWWRQEWDALVIAAKQVGNMDRILWPGVIDALMNTFLEPSTWLEKRDLLVTAAGADTSNKRRRVFIAQLACEAAAHVGDDKTLFTLLERAYEEGLFDLHWLDKCPPLAPYRDHPRVAAVRAKIKVRAEAILDALYGDHASAMSATQVA